MIVAHLLVRRRRRRARIVAGLCNVPGPTVGVVVCDGRVSFSLPASSAPNPTRKTFRRHVPLFS